MAEYKIDFTNCWLDRGKLGFGLSVFGLFIRDMISPVGLVWGDARGEKMDILGSFVPAWARRQGVRTKINELLFKDYHYKTVVTAGATKDGRAFMEASEYAFSEEFQWWFKHKPAPLGGTREAREKVFTEGW
jgi:hypothetical protein